MRAKQFLWRNILIGYRFTQVETTFSETLSYTCIVYLSLYVCYIYMHKVYVLTKQKVLLKKCH